MWEELGREVVVYMIKIHGVRSVNKRLYLPMQKEGRDGKSQRWRVTVRTRASRCNREGTHMGLQDAVACRSSRQT